MPGNQPLELIDGLRVAMRQSYRGFAYRLRQRGDGIFGKTGRTLRAGEQFSGRRVADHDRDGRRRRLNYAVRAGLQGD